MGIFVRHLRWGSRQEKSVRIMGMGRGWYGVNHGFKGRRTYIGAVLGLAVHEVWGALQQPRVIILISSH